MEINYNNLLTEWNKVKINPDQGPSDAWMPISQAKLLGIDVSNATSGSWIHLQRGKAFIEWFDEHENINQMEISAKLKEMMI